MKDMKINLYRLKQEYQQIVDNGPASIRWAKEHGKLNLQEVDPRLLDEVAHRPNLPDAVKARVKVLLREMAERIQADDSDDEDQ